MMLLDSSLRALAVAGLIALLLAALRVRTSSVRHAAWTAALAAMLLMPALSRLVPPLSLPWPANAPQPRIVGVVPQTPVGSSTAPSAVPKSVALPSNRRDDAVALQSPRPEPPSAWIPWSSILLSCSLVVTGVLTIRLAVGWSHARAISRRSKPVEGFYESELVAAPVTIGVLAPRTVLPLDWHNWSSATLRAVLHHERTHIRRRDPLIALFASINCCIFWFHPLAWWLRRTLTITVEHACDDEAARAMEDPRLYARVLIDQADAVRRHGRLVWYGVGIHGTGFLHERVDRLLRAEHLQAISPLRKFAIGVGCATAVVVVAACRHQAAPPPLREDPEVAQDLASRKAHQELLEAAAAMTPAQAADLEASLQQNPEDLDTRRRLSYYYRRNKNVRWEDQLAARRRHVLWLIEHHPEHELVREWGPISPRYDMDGAVQAQKLWIIQTSRQDASAVVFNRAAIYFQVHDKRHAEQMLLRARALDPEGRALGTRVHSEGNPWSSRLGGLYAHAILGVINPTTRTVDPATSRTFFALEARKKLDASSDATMLATAGGVLTNLPGAVGGLDLDPVALGRSYLIRALEIDPTAPFARRVLASLDDRDTTKAVHDKVHAKQSELAGGEIARKVAAHDRLTDAEQRTLNGFKLEAVRRLSPPEQLAVLPDLADGAYMGAESALDTRKDQARANETWALSRRLAEEALAVAAKYPQDPAYGTVIYRSNVTLATHALREGDRQAAVRYMLEAVEAPRSERLATVTQFGLLELKLVNYLLKAGERDSVIRFLEKSADLRDVERERFLKDAAAIRQGRMPTGYQMMVTR